MDKLYEHAIRMLEIADANDIPVIGNKQFQDIARAVYDLILQVQMLEMADRCKTCKHWWKSEEVCLLDDCKYEPKTEPQTDYTPDCPFCRKYGTEDCLGFDCRRYKTYKDEPQTERSE